jgi:putative ABC transport system ATP-binding protein
MMLDIKDVTLGYDGKMVGHLPALKLNKGEVCLITGASGSGKTTLLYAIAGLLPVMEGKIAIHGTDITALAEAARDHFRGKHIGIIFQTLHLVRSLSVLDNLMLASYAANMPQNKDHAIATLKRIGLQDKLHALPGELSQGQAQRVAIARAVLNRPSLILADEPTSSLDDDTCHKVITLIRDVAEEVGATLLIATHDSRVKPHFKNIVELEDVQ